MVRKRRYKQGELFGTLGYVLTMSGIFDKGGAEGTASELKPTATVAYFCLRSLADHHDGTASASSKEIAARIGVTKPTVDKALGELEKQGLIERLNPQGGNQRRVFQIKERLPYYEAESEREHKHSGWVVAKHSPRQTTERLKEAKHFFQTKQLPPTAIAAGVTVERLEVNVENLQVNLHVTHNHYGHTTPPEQDHTQIATELVEQLVAAIQKGGPVAEWAKRKLLTPDEQD